MKTAKVAIQCVHPDTQERGTFLFSGESHRIPGTSLSPVFVSLWELHRWATENGWKSVGSLYTKVE